MVSQEAMLSKFEADFKKQQSEMTNIIDTVLMAITDRITGALPSDIVNNPKLNVNFTSLVLSTRSYPMKDPQCSPKIHNSINAIKACSKQHNENDQTKIKTLIVNEVGTPTSKEPEDTLEDEFKDLHLNLPVLEVLAHAPIYNAIFNKNVEILELGQNGSVFIQGKMPKKKAKMAVGEGITWSVFGVKEIDLESEEVPYWTTLGRRESYGPRLSMDGIGDQTPFYARIDFLDHHLPGEWKIARDAKLIPFKDVLMFRKMIEFLEALPINLKGNMWESEDLIENPIN
nr:hypothetical protein [Tanacetum cinerariifolium]